MFKAQNGKWKKNVVNVKEEEEVEKICEWFEVNEFGWVDWMTRTGRLMEFWRCESVWFCVFFVWLFVSDVVVLLLNEWGVMVWFDLMMFGEWVSECACRNVKLPFWQTFCFTLKIFAGVANSSHQRFLARTEIWMMVIAMMWMCLMMMMMVIDRCAWWWCGCV